MKYELKFEIYGIPPDGDEAVFEMELPTLTTERLMPVMGWQSEAEAVSSYFLTPEQTDAIEHLAAITLPKDLDLFLSCHG
ncbi:hypothetical protein KS461_11850 [Pseudomonas chlororaphis]|uniref:pyocin S6 family toxin immunity protein n=1 Tax=Pseudomonas chlororaphis TaxID=587753 RepID=UPI000F575513|nr:pyocin S6 family toxin immunity protein [Pseudomonas chlororaphis]AZD07790.1 hypothetical protein C4K26_2387 [Pseudomonas chlororaphis]AZD21619.1 hypothetical protein C4K24_2316 [Pseudomonas chlororaphis subsp. aurantiaca]UVE47931.1 hypothetical protein KS461_11850 [Pseudomonas chlororaphis]